MHFIQFDNPILNTSAYRPYKNHKATSGFVLFSFTTIYKEKKKNVRIALYIKITPFTNISHQYGMDAYTSVLIFISMKNMNNWRTRHISVDVQWRINKIKSLMSLSIIILNMHHML